LIDLARIGCGQYFRIMNALTQIQESVERLSGDERKALALWLNSKIEPDLSRDEEDRLMHSLDEAAAAIDAGKGVPIDEVRRRVESWITK
jgi:hypothetical protein